MVAREKPHMPARSPAVPLANKLITNIPYIYIYAHAHVHAHMRACVMRSCVRDACVRA